MTLSRNNGFSNKLEIFDYYIPNKEGLLASSVHAKLIIADEKIAYVGSAELRLNSLDKNFEVGIMLENMNVQGLVDLFDAMTNLSKKVY